MDGVIESPFPMLVLTKQRRREACVHEAAHAVIHRLGGATVYRVAVAAEGCPAWGTERERGGIPTGLWGVCSLGGPIGIAQECIKWDEDLGDSGGYLCDRRAFARILRGTEADWNRPGFSSKMRRHLRAFVCGCLAGPVVDSFLEGDDDPWLEPVVPEEDEDRTLAHALARLLPFNREYDHLAQVTIEALRRPDIWQKVITLADELERVGDIEDVDPFLPEWDRSWPPAPPRRRSPK
jgi:hypothetical protein